MRAFLVALVLLVAACPAYAQKKTDAQKKADAIREAEQDQAYRSSLRRIPAKQANPDPWGEVRGGTGDSAVSAQGTAKKPQPATPVR